ncbi:unnamed protein product [Oikopleura dioica]|uniref:N-acetyltransferase domain-containing protein n=1 Tax=Oikopleura dioica TaxID=34765 RepID=E4XNA9_OIKDI|nr:unnamed protein product [Oikopleura dioica]
MIRVRLLEKKDEREAFTIWKEEMIYQWPIEEWNYNKNGKTLYFLSAAIFFALSKILKYDIFISTSAVLFWILLVHLHGYNTVRFYLKSRKDMDKLFENHEGRFFVAENTQTGELLGTVLFKDCKSISDKACLGKKAEDFIELGSLMVKRNRRKLGIGKMLVEKIIEEARKLDKRVFLVTSIHNQTADRFYQKNGFTRTVGEIYSFTKVMYVFAWLFEHRSLYFFFEK